MTMPHGPVFWHQGMFLQPQHFQLAELSAELRFTPYRQWTTPHLWGVCRAEVELSASGLRSLSVTSGEFLFTDGTFLNFPGNAVIEPRLLPETIGAAGSAMTAYLGLRKWQEHGENVTTVAQGEPLGRVASRFVTGEVGASRPDLYGAGPAAEVRQLSHLVRIFWQDELDLLGDYLLIPFARVEMRGEAVELSRDFIPPSVSIVSSPPLLALVREIRDLVSSRCRALEAGKKQRGIQDAEFGSKDLVYLLALRTMNRHLAQLDHIMEGEAHPWQLYGALAQLAGELSSFSATISYGGEERLLPEYCHLDLARCFSQAHDLIRTLLRQITAGPDYSLSMTYDGNYFCSELGPSHFQRRGRFFLVLSTDEEAESVLLSLAGVAKLSARERLPLLISQALPGIPLHHLPVPPQELPRRARSIYFAIDMHSDQWEQVQKWNNLALFWDQAPADLAVEIMIVSRT